MSLPNKKRGEVALPGHPEGRCIRFTMDVKERLQSAYSTEENPDWVSHVYDRIGIPDIEMMKNIISTAKVGDEPIDLSFLDDVPAVDVVDAIRDALTLSLHGKTVEEHLAALAKREEEEQEKKLQKIKAEMIEGGVPEEEINQMIFLSKLNSLVSVPGSTQTKSET